MYFIQRNCQLLHRRSHKAPKRSENPPAVPAACSSTSTPASLLSYMHYLQTTRSAYLDT